MPAAKGLAPRKQPRQARARFTVAAILEAAAHIFADRGLAGATTNLIAERAGVSIGSLYQYFPGKEALLVALVEQHVVSATERVARALAQAQAERLGPEDTVRRLVEDVVAVHAESPGLQRALLAEAPRTEALRALLERAEDTLIAAVAPRLSEAWGVPTERAARVGWVIVHAVEALAHEAAVHPPPGEGSVAVAEELVELVLGYLARAGAGAAEGDGGGDRRPPSV